MSNKIKFTPEEKLNLVLKFRELNISLSQFCRIYGIERTAMLRWSIKYDNEGSEELKTIKKITKYSSYTLIHIEEYIKFYNEERLQKNLGNRSPLEYRKYQEKNIDN